jgi:large subunit ribosomal protein L9
MEIVLRQTVDKLGSAGEVVQVKVGYARNYLVPQKLAYPVTPGNMKLIEQECNSLLRRETQQKEEAEKLRELMSGAEVSVARRVGEQDVLYGSVTSSDIAEELEKQGFTIDRRKIVLDGPIKKLGEFEIPVRLFREVTAEIKLRVEAEQEVGAAPDAAAESEPEPAPEATADSDAAVSE